MNKQISVISDYFKILSLQDPQTGGIETGITTMANEEKDNPT